jgi:hypothetical protein
MKTKMTISMFLVLLSINLFHVGCKKADVVGTFTLTVTVSEGVSGTPAAGTYTYTSGASEAYSYTLAAGYLGLTVLLDGTKVEASGSITMSGNHTLQVSSAGKGQFTLIVTVATGVNGTPTAGTYAYDKGEVVNYSYSPADGYTSLVVSLDGTTVNSSGIITMSQNHTLNATAALQNIITGTWTQKETYDDKSSFNVTVTFSGDLKLGTATDSDGGTGTYTVNGSSVVFNLVFPGVTYEYTGTFSDTTTMSGTSKRYNTAGTSYSGTWSATKNTSVTSFKKSLNKKSTALTDYH